MKKISVIIPSLSKNEALLNDLRKDLKNQTVKDFEVIEVVRKKSIPKNLNEGIRRAKGEYVTTLDTDCRVPRNWIERIIPKLEGKNVLFGYELNMTSKKFGRVNVFIKRKLARKLMFDENYDLASDTEWFEYLKKGGYERGGNSFVEPIVMHHYSRNLGKRLKSAFRHGEYWMRIAIEYKNDCEMNMVNMVKSRLFHIAQEFLIFFGEVYGFFKYLRFWGKKIPKKNK